MTKCENMNVIQLVRQAPSDNAVRGALSLPLNPDTLQVATLENADFLIPPGKYPLKMTFSPRWNKLMPEICDVPGRSGIRIHRGTIPEHSKGCVLVTAFALSYIEFFINKFITEHDDDENLYIQIV